ncbi:MAG: helix-turn-helix transcriptional regulator [Oscillospiraceae bacterium]
MLAQALTDIRKAQGLKQRVVLERLANRGANIDASAFSKIEGGHRCITDKELFALSRVYNVDVGYIYQMAFNIQANNR